jgi:hypothetical protein
MQVLKAFADRIAQTDPEVMVFFQGDFNDFIGTTPMLVLEDAAGGPGLRNLEYTITDPRERYDFFFFLVSLSFFFFVVSRKNSCMLCILLTFFFFFFRYGYQYDGMSQSLDHIIVSQSLYALTKRFEHVRVNSYSTYTNNTSDHDPMYADFVFPAASASPSASPVAASASPSASPVVKASTIPVQKPSDAAGVSVGCAWAVMALLVALLV